MNLKCAQFIPKNPIKYQSSKTNGPCKPEFAIKFPELHGGLHAAFRLCGKIPVAMGLRIV